MGRSPYAGRRSLCTGLEAEGVEEDGEQLEALAPVELVGQHDHRARVAQRGGREAEPLEGGGPDLVHRRAQRTQRAAAAHAAHRAAALAILAARAAVVEARALQRVHEVPLGRRAAHRLERRVAHQQPRRGVRRRVAPPLLARRRPRACAPPSRPAPRRTDPAAAAAARRVGAQLDRRLYRRPLGAPQHRRRHTVLPAERSEQRLRRLVLRRLGRGVERARAGGRRVRLHGRHALERHAVRQEQWRRRPRAGATHAQES